MTKTNRFTQRKSAALIALECFAYVGVLGGLLVLAAFVTAYTIR